MLVVGAVSLGFGVLSATLLVGMFAQGSESVSFWGLLLGIVLLPVGCLVFAWHLINGIALARAEDAQLRDLRAQAARAAERVEEARRRVTGRG